MNVLLAVVRELLNFALSAFIFFCGFRAGVAYARRHDHSKEAFQSYTAGYIEGMRWAAREYQAMLRAVGLIR